jgi:hypothetical protein
LQEDSPAPVESAPAPVESVPAPVEVVVVAEPAVLEPVAEVVAVPAALTDVSPTEGKFGAFLFYFILVGFRC